MCAHDVCSICSVCVDIHKHAFVGAKANVQLRTQASPSFVRCGFRFAFVAFIALSYDIHQFSAPPMLICQDNMIEHVSGLEFLSHLQQLALANNPLTDFKELRRLSHLPDLTELSFKDLNFGVGAWTMGLMCESECVRASV